MKKRSGLLAVLLASLVFHGCATQTPLVKGELKAIRTLRAVRHETPGISDQRIGRFLVGMLLGGAVGAGIAMATAKEGQAPLDYSEFILRTLCERAAREIPDWPTTMVDSVPVAADYKHRPGDAVLELKVTGLMLYQLHGLLSSVTATMWNDRGDVAWNRSYYYRSSAFDRTRSNDEFLADDAKALKEELRFAAEQTVADFLEGLRAASPAN